jgi:porin
MNDPQAHRFSVILALFVLYCFSALLADTSGVDFNLTYTGQFDHNTEGGLQRGGAYLDNLDLSAEVDGYRSFGLEGATFYGHILHNNNKGFSDRFVGDAQGVNNIDSRVNVVKLYELWWEQQLGHHNFKIGVIDLNSEFDAIDTASLFLNSSHGIGAEYAQSGANGPSIFPTPGLGFRHSYSSSESYQIQWAVFDAAPGDTNDADKNDFSIDSKDGALLTLEFNYYRPSVRYGLGAWHYTKETAHLNGGGRSKNRGWYVLSDASLLSVASREVKGWIRFGMAEEKVNTFDSYLGAGLALEGILQNRSEDLLGIALAHGRASSDYKRSIATAVDSAETTLELTYRMEFMDRYALQPNAQYIIDPRMDPSLKNAFTVALRFEISLSSAL